MSKPAISCLLFLLASFVFPAQAGNSPGLSTLLTQAKARGLANDRYWHALLHYRLQNGQSYKSEIVSSEFFLSPHGRTDPAAELEATLAAILQPVGANPDQHAQCRFIARYHWLLKNLDWHSVTPPIVACPQFQQFSLHGDIESLSLVFATGYFSNPASFYGHLLLKFNRSAAGNANELLDQSVNFGAMTPNDENGLVYVVKGLFGGYSASFTHQQFYNFNHLYAENDLRDMWEYQLNLTQDQVDQLVYHVWELLGQKFSYYFLKINCAYRMAQLLNLVVKQPLIPDLPWSIPATVFVNLSRTQVDGKALVKRVNWIPSRQSRLYQDYFQLSDKQRRITDALVRSQLDFTRPEYTELDEAERIAINDTLIDYYEYRIIGHRGDASLTRAKQQVLFERSTLAARSASDSVSSTYPASEFPPHKSIMPFMLRVGAIHNHDFGTGQELRIRPAYYDTLSLDNGRIANSTLTMLDVDIVHYPGGFHLRDVEFINLENLNFARTLLPGEGGMAWKVNFGIYDNNLHCNDCKVMRLQGGLGKAVAVYTDSVVFGMVDLFAQTQYENSGTIGLLPRVGLIASPFIQWKTMLTVGNKSYLNGERSSDSVIRWDNRFGTSQYWDIRLGYKKDVAEEVSAAVSLYW